MKFATIGMLVTTLTVAACTYSPPTQMEEETHYEHITEDLADINDVQLLVSDTSQARDSLMARIDGLPHAYQASHFSRPGYIDQDTGWTYGEESSQVYLLTQNQFKVTQLLMEALENEEFLESIGEIIEADLQDADAEHGGFVLFDEHFGLYLLDIPSAAKVNTGYSMPDGLYEEIPHLAYFHLHAIDKDCSTYAGPSRSDRSFCRHKALSQGDFHCVVITKLEGDRFNIDFFGADYESANPDGDTVDMIVLDLGAYGY